MTFPIDFSLPQGNPAFVGLPQIKSALTAAVPALRFAQNSSRQRIVDLVNSLDDAEYNLFENEFARNNPAFHAQHPEDMDERRASILSRLGSRSNLSLHSTIPSNRGPYNRRDRSNSRDRSRERSSRQISELRSNEPGQFYNGVFISNSEIMRLSSNITPAIAICRPHHLDDFEFRAFKQKSEHERYIDTATWSKKHRENYTALLIATARTNGIRVEKIDEIISNSYFDIEKLISPQHKIGNLNCSTADSFEIWSETFEKYIQLNNLIYPSFAANLSVFKNEIRDRHLSNSSSSIWPITKTFESECRDALQIRPFTISFKTTDAACASAGFRYLSAIQQSFMTNSSNHRRQNQSNAGPSRDRRQRQSAAATVPSAICYRWNNNSNCGSNGLLCHRRHVCIVCQQDHRSFNNVICNPERKIPSLLAAAAAPGQSA